jgi:hypothetical protein
MSTPTVTPAGWYADPEIPAQQRYWDGQAWTDQHAAPTQPAVVPPPPGQGFAPPFVDKPKPKHRLLKWGGAIVVVAVVIAIASSMSGSSSTSTTPNGGTAAGGGTTSAQAGIGTVVRDGNFEFVVKSLKCGVPSVGDASLGATAQGQFCLVTLSVKNIGSDPQTMIDSNQTVLSATGAKFEPSTTAELYANPSSNFFVTDINPGNAMSGVLIYDVPKTVVPTSIVLHDSMFSNGVTVNLK